MLPAQDAVVAITANTKDMQGELNLVWEHLLPAFGTSPLEANAAEQALLKETLAKLEVSPTHVDETITLPGSTPAKSSSR